MKKVVLITLIFLSTYSFSQNISLQECENQFLKNNLYLLANHFNIDAAQAQVLQAKTWDNPNVGIQLNAWTPNDEKKYFNIGNTGDKSAYIQQLIHIGGQRRNQINIAKSNAEMAELDFSTLMQDLKQQLRNSFFTIYFDNKSITHIDKQMISLKTVIDNYSIQEKKGNVSLKDLVRLQNIYLALKTSRSDLMNDIIDNKKTLEILISEGKNLELVPTPTIEELDRYKKPISNNVEDLQKMALENRPDLKKALKNIEANNWNLKLQKSLVIPDVTFGVTYDQNGGAFTNQSDFTIGIPLPLWNRNRGNIRSAKAQLSQAEVQKKIQEVEVIGQVKSAFLKYLEQKSNYELVSSNIPIDLEIVFNGVYSNFLKRNMSMLEFTDFLDSYNQSVLSLNQISKSYINSCEEINHSSASKLF
ncbi:MAG: TolC family protein [Flavobacterium sp.]